MNRGSLLLEHLVALLILTPVMGGALLTLKRINATYHLIQDAAGLEERIIALRIYFGEIIQDYDSHRLMIPPRIHPKGEITFTDDTLFPFPANSLVPSTTSDAATGVKLDLLHRFGVVEHKISSGHSFFRGCLLKGISRYSLDSAHSFAAISLGGIFEASLTNPTLDGDGACIEGILNITKSMSLEPPPTETPPLQILIPIIDHYTLYVDSTQALRYLSHAGSLTLENQPLLSLKGEMLLTLSSAHDQTRLDATFLPSRHSPVTFAATSHLARKRGLDLILNR